MFYTIQIWVLYCLKEQRSDVVVVVVVDDDAATTTCTHGYKVKINTIAKLDLPHRTSISEGEIPKNALDRFGLVDHCLVRFDRLPLLFVQAEENAGPGGTCEDEASEDVNLEVRTDLVCANYSFFSLCPSVSVLKYNSSCLLT